MNPNTPDAPEGKAWWFKASSARRVMNTGYAPGSGDSLGAATGCHSTACSIGIERSTGESSAPERTGPEPGSPRGVLPVTGSRLAWGRRPTVSCRAPGTARGVKGAFPATYSRAERVVPRAVSSLRARRRGDAVPQPLFIDRHETAGKVVTGHLLIPEELLPCAVAA